LAAEAITCVGPSMRQTATNPTVGRLDKIKCMNACVVGTEFLALSRTRCNRCRTVQVQAHAQAAVQVQAHAQAAVQVQAHAQAAVQVQAHA